ncbi:hypothetical protein C8R46DRAFT_1098796 [Mycena filopes]|nr:hypothetical protein C8R46DRAFT_1098796 [Mycena filopes]
MQFKSLLLPLLILATGSTINASALNVDELAIAGRTLVERTATATTVTGTTGTKTVTSATNTATSASCNWCECFEALAAQGIACAAAVLEGGCNIFADASCILDSIIAARTIPKCIACL